MTIIAQAEKNQIVRVNWFAAFAGHKVELVFVLLRRDLRIDFAAHAQDRFFRNGSRRKKSFPRHPEVALFIVGWNTALISERDTNQVPRQIMRDRRKPRVNRPRRVSARERNAKLV